MRCHKNQAALVEMAAHEFGHALLGGGIERAGRLVEQPDRPFDRNEPRDR